MPLTFNEVLSDIDLLVRLWRAVQGGSRLNLDILIKNKMKTLRFCKENSWGSPEHPRYGYLERLAYLKGHFVKTGYKTDTLDDVILMETKTLVTKDVSQEFDDTEVYCLSVAPT